MMLKTLKLQIDKRFNIKDVSLKFKDTVGRDEKIKILSFLHGITIQSGSISIKEKEIIKQISYFFGLNNEDYQSVTRQARKQKEKKQTRSRTRSKVYGYDPYKILGITAKATVIEIKKAYRKMVLKYHPDRTDVDDSIANEKFSEISEAYYIIKKERNIK